MENEKAYEKVIEWIEDRIMDGIFKIGDKLPSERELAANLGVSRNSVREGMRILEVIGVITSQHGMGNYIAAHFDNTLMQMMTMMYALEDMTYDEIGQFRYALEMQAMELAVENITEKDMQKLENYLDVLENSQVEDIRQMNDKMIHYTIVQSSGNRLIITNYLALTKVMDYFIREARQMMIRTGANREFQLTHRKLVEAMLGRDAIKGKEALKEHYVYICKKINT